MVVYCLHYDTCQPNHKCVIWGEFYEEYHYCCFRNHFNNHIRLFKKPTIRFWSICFAYFYKDYSCDQVTLEMQRVASKVSEVSGVQRSKATNDAVVTGVGVVIFWPALFFLMGDDKEQELAQLKGELDALEQAAVQKNCHQLLDRIKRERDEVEETN